MSFILDALKKSEIERQRQTVPGLMDARSSERRGRLPVWALALGALLAVNLLVLTFLLTKKGAPAATAPRSAPTVAAREVEAGDSPSAADHFSPLDSAPVYAPEIPVPATGSAAAREPPIARATPAAEGPGKALRATRHPDPVLSDEDAQADSQEVLPSISEINLSGAQALPELHLDVHVYATKPADRFVYINMRKYHEGAALQEGPTVERIRRDGVVLNYQGLRFILPRQP
ncbi:MAG TPA: general secretion pathway protein GspB [Steroidobacteraceae bacterium]|nr:general secretion pathway protein GspB [Steroidobacteraceae bacterium]